MVFETQRLRLRAFSMADGPFVLELVNDAAWIRFIGDRNVHSLDDTRTYLKKLIQSYTEHGFGLYLVERKSDAEALGMCGLVKRDTLPHADLGFAFLERFRGQGYAVEAAQGTLRYVRETLGLGRILAIATPDNARSHALLAKLGFVRERAEAFSGNAQDVVEVWSR